MFEDHNGNVYWLWSPNKIAELKDDMKASAEALRYLACQPHFCSCILH